MSTPESRHESFPGVVKILTLSILFVLQVDRASGKVTAGDNGNYYDTLCRIYKFAEKPSIEGFSLEEPQKVIQQIETIEVAMAEPEWFKEVENAKQVGDLSEAFKKKYPEFTTKWEGWKKIIEKLSEKGTNYTRLQLQDGQKFRNQIKKIATTAHRIFGEIQQASGATQRQKIDESFQNVIFGTGADEIESAVKGLPATRAAACGSNSGTLAKGQKAGSSLVVDLLCLCAAGLNTDTGIADACGVTVGTTGSNCNRDEHECWKGEQITPAAATRLWNAIKGGCDRKKLAPPSVENAVRLTSEFLALLHLGGQEGNAKRTPGLLGTCGNQGTYGCNQSSYGCNGSVGDSSSQGGYCVFYGERDNWHEIQWLKKFDEAIQSIKALNKTQAAAASKADILKMLHTRAEELFEEAKTVSEGASPVSEKPTQNQKQNPSTPTDKSTAQDPNTVSGATIPLFIMPWPLL